MSDRMETAVLWLQRAMKLIGLLLTLLGGSQAANIAPAALEGDGAAAGGNTLIGLGLMMLTPAVDWVVRTVYSKTRGKQLTPVADLVAGETAVVTLETQLADDTSAMDACKVLRKSLSTRFQNAGQKPALLVVDVK